MFTELFQHLLKTRYLYTWPQLDQRAKTKSVPLYPQKQIHMKNSASKRQDQKAKRIPNEDSPILYIPISLSTQCGFYIRDSVSEWQDQTPLESSAQFQWRSCLLQRLSSCLKPQTRCLRNLFEVRNMMLLPLLQRLPIVEGFPVAERIQEEKVRQI